jgi:hypothetical protein
LPAKINLNLSPSLLPYSRNSKHLLSAPHTLHSVE